ncbi:toll-like receptor 1 [Sardina pilchardus]|uniref:toll-like receptor 1 n=1 Tax=Sardina pilchardus TaxID=27697 RepID=UPI002E13422B
MDVTLSSSLLLSFLLIASVWLKDAAGTCIIPGKDRIDLSDQNLTSMPSNLPRNTQYLDLSFNTISTLTSTDLVSLSALCIFKMANCGLISISPAAFQRNPHLQELDLSFNRLSAIPEIQGLPKLRILDLSENLYESFTLGQSFQNLQSLSSLSLGGTKVSHMDKFDLTPLSRSPLRELALQAGDDLTHFNTDFLGYLLGLKSLALQINFCKTPKLFKKVLLDLQMSSVDTLIIEKFLPEFCDVSANLTDDLRSMGKLRHLILKDTWITSSLASQILVHVIQSPLQTFSVLNCSYDQDSEGLEVLSVPDLSKIGNLRAVTLNTLHYYHYSRLHASVNLSLLQGVVKAEFSGMGLSAPGNILHEVIGDLSTLQTLDVSNNNLACNNFFVKLSKFRVLSCLKELIIRNNKLRSLNTIVWYMNLALTHLETLDLSFNPIMLPAHKKVIWPSHLKNLSLSGILLGDHLFDHLSPHFVSINLTHTDVTSVNTDALQSMKDLKQLLLGSNAIRELPPDLLLPALEELHVDLNSISTFKPETFRGLPKLKKLNGGNNPFVCDCDLYWFVHDFNKTLLVDWPAAYSCYSPTHLSGILLKDFHPSQVACDPLIMFTICFTVVLFALTSCGIVFHVMDGAWYVKMLWIWLRVKRRSRNKDRRLMSSTFNYHAFISYSVKDAQWVQSELAPHLETSNFQLCLHERDFVPGEWVIDNIINCVESSYKTVFVLSQSFVQSEWCNYELFFAQHRAIDVQRDSLVLILLEPIPPDSLSRKFLRLRSLLRQQTYLSWPREEPKRQLFWASLTAMLRTGDNSVVAGKSAVLQQVAGDIADLCHNEADYTEHDPLLED